MQTRVCPCGTTFQVRSESKATHCLSCVNAAAEAESQRILATPPPQMPEHPFKSRWGGPLGGVAYEGRLR